MLEPTPAQPAGPFYPASKPPELDADLVSVAGKPHALGQIALVSGRVLGTDGAPRAGALIEIWQCDFGGRYHHIDDEQEGLPDPGFQGYGAALTDAEGSYRFRTIQPVPYAGRTPHIHVMVSAVGIHRLVTQLYVVGAPSNARDGLFSRLAPDEQRRLLVDFQPAPGTEPGARAGHFDIVVEAS